MDYTKVILVLDITVDSRRTPR